jgi:hypothetical protein
VNKMRKERKVNYIKKMKKEARGGGEDIGLI